jgi:hypothetical protein
LDFQIGVLKGADWDLVGREGSLAEKPCRAVQGITFAGLFAAHRGRFQVGRVFAGGESGRAGFTREADSLVAPVWDAGHVGRPWRPPQWGAGERFRYIRSSSEDQQDE